MSVLSIDIPAIVKDKYIELCTFCNDDINNNSALLRKYKAEGFLEAVYIILGPAVVDAIASEADNAFPDINTCGGIKLSCVDAIVETIEK